MSSNCPHACVSEATHHGRICAAALWLNRSQFLSPARRPTTRTGPRRWTRWRRAWAASARWPAAASWCWARAALGARSHSARSSAAQLSWSPTGACLVIRALKKGASWTVKEGLRRLAHSSIPLIIRVANVGGPARCKGCAEYAHAGQQQVWTGW